MLSFILFLATTCLADIHAAGNAYVEDTDRFPGWKGELPTPSKTRAQEHNATQRPGMAVRFGQPDKELWNGHIEQIAWHPRIFRLHGFLTDAECEHIKRKVCDVGTVVVSTPILPTFPPVTSHNQTHTGTPTYDQINSSRQCHRGQC